MVFEVEFDNESLENDFIEVYREDEDFDKAINIYEMWVKIAGLFDDIEKFVRKYTGRKNLEYNDLSSIYGVKVYDLVEEECKKLLEHKEELIGGYIINVKCSNK